MARKLYLYSANWNKDGGVFIDFQTISKENWFTLLQASENPIAVVTLDNYRVDDGTISVAGLSEQKLGRVAYAIDVDTNKTDGKFDYWRCYHVKNCRSVSGYALFSVSLDLWGSFFSDAYITNLRVIKSNMNVGKGTFDQILYTHTENTLTEEYYKPVPLTDLYSVDDDGNAYMSDENAYLVFTANCVVTDTDVTDTSSSVSANYIFANTLKAIRESYPEAVRTAHNSVELAARMISGVVGIPTGSGNWKMRQCDIQHVFIVPASWIELETEGMNFKYKTPFYNTALSNMPFRFVKPYWNKIPVNITAGSLDPNYKWLLGTIDKGIELARSTQNDVAYYDVTLTYDGLHVIVRQGTTCEDISTAFEISLIGKSQEADVSTKLCNFFAETMNMVGSAAKAATSKNPIGSGVAVAANGTAAQLQKLAARAEPSGSVSSADGYITYNYAAPDKVTYPFYFTFYKSARDEQQNARVHGANFDDIYKNWSSLIAKKSALFYITGKNPIPFIQCDCLVTDIGEEASEYIMSKLRGGVYVYTTTADTIAGLL